MFVKRFENIHGTFWKKGIRHLLPRLPSIHYHGHPWSLHQSYKLPWTKIPIPQYISFYSYHLMAYVSCKCTKLYVFYLRCSKSLELSLFQQIFKHLIWTLAKNRNRLADFRWQSIKDKRGIISKRRIERREIA